MYLVELIEIQKTNSIMIAKKVVLYFVYSIPIYRILWVQQKYNEVIKHIKEAMHLENKITIYLH